MVLKMILYVKSLLKATLTDDGSGVNITVLSSTFNQPSSQYFVLIDDGFVKSRIYQEPIIGIQDDVWTFSTRKYFIYKNLK